MDDLSHLVTLCDNVVAPIIEGVDDFQFVVEQVVGAKTQVLVSMGRFSVHQDFHPSIILSRDKSIQKRDANILFWFVCEFDLSMMCEVLCQLILLVVV